VTGIEAFSRAQREIVFSLICSMSATWAGVRKTGSVGLALICSIVQ